jgi:hypothetical protein
MNERTFGYGSSELHRQGEMTAESLIRVLAATGIHRSMSDESTDWTTPAIGSTLTAQFATRPVSVSRSNPEPQGKSGLLLASAFLLRSPSFGGRGCSLSYGGQVAPRNDDSHLIRVFGTLRALNHRLSRSLVLAAVAAEISCGRAMFFIREPFWS